MVPPDGDSKKPEKIPYRFTRILVYTFKDRPLPFPGNGQSTIAMREDDVMNSYNANVVIHVDEELSDKNIHSLEHELAGVPGIVSSCVHERTRHLWVVDYDPRKLRSTEVLTKIKNTGLHAELIGGI